MREALAGLVAGLLIGIVVLVGLRAAPEPGPARTAETQTRTETTWVRPDCPEESTLATTLDDLSAEVELARAAFAVANAQNEVAVGTALDWPADIDARFTEPELERVLGELAGDGTLLGLDCGEYPCTAHLSFDDLDAANAFDDAVYERFPTMYGASGWLTSDDEPDIFTKSLALPMARPEDDNGKKRIKYRLTEVSKLFPAR